jgi:hypothetical protein
VSAASTRRSRSPVSLRLSLAIAVWSLCSLGAALGAAESTPGTGAAKAGAFIARLFTALILAYLIRGAWRLIRRRPLLHPGWTPALFYGAAVISVLETVSTVHH